MMTLLNSRMIAWTIGFGTPVVVVVLGLWFLAKSVGL